MYPLTAAESEALLAMDRSDMNFEAHGVQWIGALYPARSAQFDPVPTYSIAIHGYFSSLYGLRSAQSHHGQVISYCYSMFDQLCQSPSQFFMDLLKFVPNDTTPVHSSVLRFMSSLVRPSEAAIGIKASHLECLLENSIVVDRRDFIVSLVTTIWGFDKATQMGLLITQLINKMSAVTDEDARMLNAASLLAALALTQQESITVDKKSILITLVCALRHSYPLDVMEEVLKLDDSNCTKLDTTDDCGSALDAMARIEAALGDANLSPESIVLLQQCSSAISSNM